MELQGNSLIFCTQESYEHALPEFDQYQHFTIKTIATRINSR